MSDVEQDIVPAEIDSEDEFDWEEVEVPEHEPVQKPQHFEITLQARPTPQKSKQKQGISHAERLIRIDCHKIHTITLLGNAWTRNKWLNDPLLHARLISLTPLALQNAFGVIHKSRVPEQSQRGRMFEAAMNNLVQWWSSEFFEVIPDGHIRNRTFDEVQKKIDLFIKSDQDPDSPLDIETLKDILDEDGEQIRNANSLMKHALMRSGSRDTSAQLFTALCRGLAIPARLVVSLQSVPWQASVGKPKPKYEKKSSKGTTTKGKAKDEAEETTSRASSVSGFEGVFTGEGRRLDDGIMPVKSEKAKGKEKAKPVINLRKSKTKGRTLGSASSSSAPQPTRLASPDPLTTAPVFWTEVFSRPDARWLPVDPIRGIVNKRKIFDPSPNPSGANPQPKVKQENRMVYVLAFEEDGYARDVTRRYAREYGAKVAKVQGGSTGVGAGGKGRQAWWDRVVGKVRRPYQLHRDDLEDQELATAQWLEGMPTTMSGFKDHPLYVLTRHLKQTETIHPPPPDTPELGKFRGEPVYSRSSVVSLKTSENWMRSEGRSVKPGCQPLKFIKVRAGTVNRMRELEVMKDELREAGTSSSAPGAGSEEMMQGLYAHSQTEPYVPDPVVDGKVPKNNFGNIDLYVPSMLPKGAAHVPFKGVAKIARKLGYDFAEAVTGFEFKKRRAFPIIEGVVVAAENEPALLEAYWDAEKESEEKARIKREDRALKRWIRLIQGLRIRKRLQEQYATNRNDERSSITVTAHRGQEESKEEAHDTVGSGGFLAGADEVVQAFHLPKYTHVTLAPTPPPANAKSNDDQGLEGMPSHSSDYLTYEHETMDVDSDMEEMPLPIPPVEPYGIPKTMQELAEEAATQQGKTASTPSADDPIEELDILPVTQREKGTIKISPRKRITSDSGSTSIEDTKKTNKTRHVSVRKRGRKNDSVNETEESEVESEVTPRKRVRARSLATVEPAPTRTLRPRASKSAAQIAQEKEAEDAYRRAIGGK